MKIKLRLDLKQLFVICFLVLFICSGISLLLRNQELSANFAVISLTFLVLALICNPIRRVIYIFLRLIDKIGILSFRQLLLVICLFYFIPLFVQFEQHLGWYLRSPKVYGGDEEHYLVMINSLIKDFDLELRNNYENARNGGYDAGEYWRGRNLDPHAYFISKDKKSRFYIPHTIDVGTRFEKWEILPEFKKIHEDRDNYYVRPHHPPGMPFILSLFLWPFRGWRYIESVAIGLITVLSIISLGILYKMIEILCKDKKWANISIFLIALGTPLYHYSLLLFKESFLASILVLSCWLFFFKKQGFLSGALVVLGCFTRYSFPIVAIPMFLFGLLKREWKLIVNFSIALVFGGVFLILYNYYMYEGPFYFSQMQFGRFLTLKMLLLIFLYIPVGLITLYLLFRFLKIKNFIERNVKWLSPLGLCTGVIIFSIISFKNSTLRMLFVDSKIGLIPFSPILIFGFLKIMDIKIWRNSRVSGMLGIMLAYLGIYIARGYAVGSAYTAREFVPIIPLMALPLCYWLIDNKNKVLGIIFSILAVYSLCVNILASIAQQYFWHLPLGEAFVQLVKKWLWL